YQHSQKPSVRIFLNDLYGAPSCPPKMKYFRNAVEERNFRYLEMRGITGMLMNRCILNIRCIRIHYQ
ncbi:MAG: hypothetical protein Q8859_08685, partial [Bacteroidota bacterium]|nr:hypothetical protein [Bacteroidota bacterium]